MTWREAIRRQLTPRVTDFDGQFVDGYLSATRTPEDPGEAMILRDDRSVLIPIEDARALGEWLIAWAAEIREVEA